MHHTKNGSRFKWNHLLSTESRNDGKAVIIAHATFHDCSVALRAVAFIEIFFYLLKARLRSVSHLWPVRCFMTAWVTKTAVSIRETTFYLLLVKISCKNVLPSPIIKISMSDCLQAVYISSTGSSFCQGWVSLTALGIWFESHMALRKCIIWQYRLLISSLGSRTKTCLKRMTANLRKHSDIKPAWHNFRQSKRTATTAWQPR